MCNYPFLEQFYKDNFSKLLDWGSPLRPSKSCPKNGAAGVAKFLDFYKKTGMRSFTEDEVLTIINPKGVEDGDTIFHQNLRVMRELKFVSASDNGSKKYNFTEQFISFANSNHSVECYIIEKLMSLSSVDDLTMYFNFLICVMREAAIHGHVILYRDSADKFAFDVSDEQKRKEHQERIYKIYGFKGDEARNVPEHYTPNISYFCHAVLKQLGILTKSDDRIDNMGTLVLTPLGEFILKKIDENLQNVQQQSQEWKGGEKQSGQNQKTLQQIFYGAPGTGKSNTIKRDTEAAEKDDRAFRTTFHPDSDYSTFVGCYKPTMKPTGVILASNEKEEVITYKFTPQAFTNAYVKAWNTNEDVYLIIEEINRGNCAQIFGDLFQLLDRKDGYSEYPVDADSDLSNYLQEKLSASTRSDFPKGVKEGVKLVLPNNLYIWATMNTSDQSLFPIDSAFKRRWEWVYIPIKDHEDKNYTIEIGDSKYNWWGFLERINEVINSTTSSEDKKLGYFFAKAEDGIIKAEQFVGKVLFYLWNDVFKNYGFDNPVFEKEDKKKFAFSDFFLADGKPNVENINIFMERLNEKVEKDSVMTIKKQENPAGTEA